MAPVRRCDTPQRARGMRRELPFHSSSPAFGVAQQHKRRLPLGVQLQRFKGRPWLAFRESYCTRSGAERGCPFLQQGPASDLQ